MASQLYKGEHMQLFPAHRVQGMLEAGWTTKPTKKEKKDVVQGEEALRKKAKDLKIPYYWAKSVATLKAEIYGTDSVDPV